MINTTFNDNLLAQLFLELQRDFKAQRIEGKSVEACAQYIGENLHWSLENGHLRNLLPAEKHKAYQVLDTVIQSMPAFQALPKQDQTFEIPRTYTPKEIHHHHHHGYYCNHSDPWLTWYVLSTWSRPTYIINNNYGGGIPSSNHHGRQKDKKDDDAFAKLILFLVMAGLLLSAFVLSFFALRELIDCGDRIVHSEGVLRAVLSMSIMAGAGLTGAFIGSVLLAGPLAALALAAGTSPAVVIMVATFAMAMIGSGIVGLLFSQFKLQEYFIGKGNKNCIDPSEPERFSLTAEQEQDLIDNGLDIVKVKCAMVAIRNEMDSNHVQDKMWRMFTSKGESHQALLEQLRNLKDGKYMRDIKVGDMVFDLRAPAPETGYYYQEPPAYTDYEPQPYVVQPQPSAPPMEEVASLYPPLHEEGVPPTYAAYQQFAQHETGGYSGMYPDLQTMYYQ